MIWCSWTKIVRSVLSSSRYWLHKIIQKFKSGTVLNSYYSRSFSNFTLKVFQISFRMFFKVHPGTFQNSFWNLIKFLLQNFINISFQNFQKSLRILFDSNASFQNISQNSFMFRDHLISSWTLHDKKPFSKHSEYISELFHVAGQFSPIFGNTLNVTRFRIQVSPLLFNPTQLFPEPIKANWNPFYPLRSQNSHIPYSLSVQVFFKALNL